MSHSLSTASVGHGKSAEVSSSQGETTQGYHEDLTFQDPVNFQVLWKEMNVCFWSHSYVPGPELHILRLCLASPNSWEVVILLIACITAEKAFARITTASK